MALRKAVDADWRYSGAVEGHNTALGAIERRPTILRYSTSAEMLQMSGAISFTAYEEVVRMTGPLALPHVSAVDEDRV